MLHSIIGDSVVMKSPYKIGFFYYTLGNLDPILRSSLKNIHLCVAEYNVIKKYGIEEILKPILDSLLDLEKV